MGQFFGRTFRGKGNWAAAAQAAAWPVGLLLVMAAALATPSYGQDDGDAAVGWGGRLRIALALLLQALGGGFELSGASQSRFDGSSSGSDGFGSGPDFAATGGAELSLVPLTVTVLWVAALFLGTRLLRTKQSDQSDQPGQPGQTNQPARTTHLTPTRTAGLEAAVRITLLVTAAVLVIGLLAQPEIEGVEVSSTPLLAALGTLVLSLAVTAGVLQRDDLTQWLAQRPAAGAAVRALGTALRVFGAVVALCTLVGFVLYATADDVDGEALLLALPILPNIGLLVFGASWGVPVEYDVRGASNFFGSSGSGGGESGSFGLGELSDAQGAGAVTGVLALGLVCALALGLWAARRSADRREQLMASGFFLALFLLFIGLTGVSVELSGQVGEFGSAQGAMEVAPSVPYALLFGLLWVGGATLLAPYLLKATGGAFAGTSGVAPTPTPPLHPAYTPGAQIVPMAAQDPATPDQQGHPDTVYVVPAPAPAFGPAPVHPEANAQAQADAQARANAHAQAQAQAQAQANAQALTYVPGLGPTPTATPAPNPERRRRVLVWTGTLTAAFIIGGSATAGALLLQNKDDGGSDTVKDNKPAVAQSGNPSAPAASSPPASQSVATPSPSSPPPSFTPSPSVTPTSPLGSSEVPGGFRQVTDPAGFTFAIPNLWAREKAVDGQIKYAGSTGMEHLLVGVIRNPTYASSYDNFVGLEKKARANQQNFQRLRLEQNTFKGRPGAMWEYTYTDKQSGETLHAIDQGYIAENGVDYSIYTRSRDRDWEYAQRTFDTALATWALN